MGNHFSIDQIPDLSNKVYVITGANAGIGYVTALEIARRNGHVIMCCRSEEKTNAAILKIRHEFQSSNLQTHGKLDYVHLDLMSLKSAETAARAIRKQYPKIDCIVNNAGIMAPPFTLTSDNIESQFGTNHMGHFVLTMLLLPALVKSGRIVNLSSMGHHFTYPSGILELEQVMGDKECQQVYQRGFAYGSSKLANILFTKYLAPRVQCYAVHPGTVHTGLFNNVGPRVLVDWVCWLVMKTPAQGAVTSLRAATDPYLDSAQGKLAVPSGTYFVPYGKPVEPSYFACDPNMAQKLWDLSVSITKLVLGEKVAIEIQHNLESQS